jgi:tetratricopeptide (TPR) repeat protein
MLRDKITLFFLCLALTGCASSTPSEDANMANVLCEQGKALLEQNKDMEARDIYTSATNRDPENVRAWNGLGVANDLLGNRTAALEDYQHALDLAPDDLSAQNNLAHLYLEASDNQKAIEILEPLLGNPAAPMTVRENFIAAHEAALIKKEADETFADLGSYPTDAMAQGHIAEVKELLGKDAKDLTFEIMPEVKTGGGLTSFTLKVIGKPPQWICNKLNKKAFPCVVSVKQ